MTPAEMRELISRLQVRAPISDAAEREHWPRPARAWYRDQREHWIEWLHDHTQRGTTSAGKVYDQIQCVRMLLWLVEAAGGDEQRIRGAIKRAASLRHHSARCNAIRQAFPWRIVRNLLERSKPQ